MTGDLDYQDRSIGRILVGLKMVVTDPSLNLSQSPDSLSPWLGNTLSVALPTMLLFSIIIIKLKCRCTGTTESAPYINVQINDLAIDI